MGRLVIVRPALVSLVQVGHLSSTCVRWTRGEEHGVSEHAGGSGKMVKKKNFFSVSHIGHMVTSASEDNLRVRAAAAGVGGGEETGRTMGRFDLWWRQDNMPPLTWSRFS